MIGGYCTCSTNTWSAHSAHGGCADVHKKMPARVTALAGVPHPFFFHDRPGATAVASGETMPSVAAARLATSLILAGCSSSCTSGFRVGVLPAAATLRVSLDLKPNRESTATACCAYFHGLPREKGHGVCSVDMGVCRFVCVVFQA